MKTALLFCFLVALCAAEQQNGAWRKNTEYRYKVHTHTLAAIPNLKNQWVGLYTKADLSLRPLSKDVLIGKMYNGQYSEWHDELPKGPTHQPEKELSYQPMEMNTEQFEIRLNNGAIHSIAVEKDMTNVQLNQLKSIISQLQVDIQARNIVNDKHNHLPQNRDQNDNNNQALYKVMEPTVTGKCETTYDISRVPEYLAQAMPEYDSAMPLEKHEHFYELYKTKNYSNCEQRMGYNFGIKQIDDWTPNTNQMGSLSKSAISRVIISGSYDKYTIRSSVTTNRVVKANPDKEVQHDTEVVSQVNVTLVSMEETNAEPQKPSKELVDAGNLVYSYNLPSDKKNTLRPKRDSSEEQDDETEYTGLLSNYARRLQQEDEDQDEEHRHQHKQSRPRRSIHNNIDEDDDKRRHNRERKNQRDETEQTWNRKEYHQPRPTLKYAPEDPLSIFGIGNKGKSIQHSENINAVHEVEKLTEEIAEDLKNANEIPVKYTLRKFNVLAKLIRTMDAEQIEEVTRKMEEKHSEKDHEKCQRIYADALATAGTGPAVNELMTMIEQRKIKGETAAELIAVLAKTIRQPTEEMQQRFFDFVKNDAVKNQDTVNTAAGIAFTRFMYQARVNNKYTKNFYPIQTYGRMADRDDEFVSNKVVPYFEKELENAVREKDATKVLYAIRALGNLGHSDVPKVFEKYLTGEKRVTDFQRLAMVLALDRYAKHYPKSAQQILFQLYQNKGETHEIRVAAVFQLMRTQPSADLLQRMAEETHHEENSDVRAAVRSAIESAAELKNPENVQLARNAKSAKNLLKKEEQGVQYSRTYLRDYAISQMDTSFEQQYSYINGKDSFIPKGVFLNAMSRLGGFKSQPELQAIVSSIEQLTNVLRENVKQNEERQREREHGQDQSKWSAENIHKWLNMKPTQAKELEGQILINLMNNERFITFDKQTLQQIVHKVKKMADELRQGVKIHYTKLFNQEDVTISFPLETGIPLVYSQRTPTLVQVNGKVQAEINNERKMQLNAEIEAVYSVQHEISLSFVNPSTRQRYMAGYDKNAQIYLPIRVAHETDLRSYEMKTEFKPLHTQQPTKVLQMGSWPYTTRENIMTLRPLPESKHTKDIHSRPVHESRYTIGENETGYKFVIKGTQEKDADHLTNVFNQVRKQGLSAIFVFGQQAASPKHYSLNVVLDAAQSSTKSTKVTIKYDSQKQFEQNAEVRQQQHPRARGQSADGQENLAVPESTKPNSQQRREQFLRNAAEGLKAPTADVLDVAVEFNGDKNIEYIATIAGASSKTDGKSRILMFVQKSGSALTSKAFMIQADAKHETVDRNGKPRVEYKIHGSFALDNQLELASIHGKIVMQQSEKLNQLVGKQQWRNENAIDMIDAELELKGAEAHVLLKQLNKSTWYNYVRYVSSKYLQEESKHQGEKDKVLIEARLSPEMESVRVTLKTENQKIEWTGVPLPEMTKHIAVVPTSWTLREQVIREAIQKRDSCTIRKNEINTFENREVKYDQLGNTWHLAVHKMRPSTENERDNNKDNKDNKNEHEVSVLVRDYESEKKNKEVLIVLHMQKEKDITLRLKPSQQQGQNNDLPRLFVDEQEKEVRPQETTEVRSNKDNKHTLARVNVVKVPQSQSQDAKYILQVETKKGQLVVKYDGQKLNIRSKGMMRNNRGVCGAFTGQKINDLKSPEKKIMRDDKEFVASWAIIDESNASSALKQMQYRIKQAQYPREEVLYSSPVQNKNKAQRKYNDERLNENYDNERSYEQEREQDSHKNHAKSGTKHQTQYVEDKKNGRICFSKRPLPVCTEGTKANGKVVRDVEVICRDINDQAAQQYKQQIHRGRSLDLNNYNSDDTFKFNVPKRCEQL